MSDWKLSSQILRNIQRECMQNRRLRCWLSFHIYGVLLKTKKEGRTRKYENNLFSDVTKQYAKKYGYLVDHGENNETTFRATFIIDKVKILSNISINDLPVVRNIGEILKLIQAFQFTDAHGKLWLAKWKQ